jgi:hypothetical protein
MGVSVFRVKFINPVNLAKGDLDPRTGIPSSSVRNLSRPWVTDCGSLSGVDRINSIFSVGFNQKKEYAVHFYPHLNCSRN